MSKWTRATYEMVAEILTKYDNVAYIDDLAVDFAKQFALDNDRFNSETFFKRIAEEK